MNTIVPAQSTALVPISGDWSDDTWSGVQAAFQMDERKPEEILFARYTQESYEGHAQVLYRNGRDYFYVSGSHCSCFGLEDQWEPEQYTLETLIAALERSDGDERSFGAGDGQILLPSLRNRLTRRLARDRARSRVLARAA